MLTAENLSAFRAERLVFSGLDFFLAAGGAMQVSGPNGAGKSTLLRLLAGLLRPAGGRLTWNGADALDDLLEHARRVAYLGHQDAIKPGLSVRANLSLHGDVVQSLAALEALGLGKLAEFPARLLSAGQRRRLAIARLTMVRAPIWLLDEPTLGLDDASVGRLGRLAEQHRAVGGLIIAATHVALPLENIRVLRLGD